MGFLSWFGPVGDLIKWAGGVFSEWDERRTTLSRARLDADVAEIKAKAELATYRVKADLEWDLKWADGAQSSWKDEFILILWAIPMIGLFIPPIRPYVEDGFEFLKSWAGTDAPQWYMAGWGILFAATFGIKQALQFMLPGRVSKLATAIGSIPDDIPEEVAERVHEALTGTDVVTRTKKPEFEPKIAHR